MSRRDDIRKCDLLIPSELWEQCQVLVRRRRFSMTLRIALRGILQNLDRKWLNNVRQASAWRGSTGHRISVEIPIEDLLALESLLHDIGKVAPALTRQDILLHILKTRMLPELGTTSRAQKIER